MTPAKVAEAFDFQSKACADLGSPFMAQLCRLLAERPWPDCAITRRIFSWPGDLSPSSASIPLRLCGGLHALHLTRDLFHKIYPPAVVNDDQLWGAVTHVLVAEDSFLNAWIDSAPQTNEVQRSALIIAAGHVIADHFPLPIRTSELGASGGLNLKWDHYGLRIGADLWGADDILVLEPDWTGPLPPSSPPSIIERRGVDLNPLNPTNPSDSLRLQAYLWPDQPDRLARTKSALSIADPLVDQGDAIDWLEPRLRHQTGQTHIIYNTVAWQYFPNDVQKRGRELIEAAGAKATADSPLAWFSMETDGTSPGAALTLRLWPGDVTLHLGRADFHGRWVRWSGQ
ncbi:MAG: DUF2332 family protein [Pseudomonadota bacterium]